MRMQLQDDKTGQVYTVDPTKVRETLETRDGVKVKIYPTVIKLTVGRNQKVDGQAPTGARTLTRLT
jgi:hypothetical protein